MAAVGRGEVGDEPEDTVIRCFAWRLAGHVPEDIVTALPGELRSTLIAAPPGKLHSTLIAACRLRAPVLPSLLHRCRGSSIRRRGRTTELRRRKSADGEDFSSMIWG